VSKLSLLVIGCGDVAAPVAAHCAAAGWRVWGLRRQPVAIPGVEAIAADVTDPQTLAPLAALAPDYVLATLTPGEFSDEGYRAVYVEGLRNCLRRLNRTPLRRLFWVSSTSVFHQDDGSRVDETSAAQAQGFSGRRLLEAEQLLAGADLPHTIVRLGGIYGPGRERLLRQLRAQRRSPSAPPHYSNRIHRDDATAILQWLLLRAAADAPLHDLYLGVDAEPAPIATVERWFAAYLGLDYDAMTPQQSAPRGGNRRCSSARLQEAGYRFIYPTYREGLPTLLAPRR
jgi:nucleoside-diphosphate-sugar epimerase